MFQHTVYYLINQILSILVTLADKSPIVVSFLLLVFSTMPLNLNSLALSRTISPSNNTILEHSRMLHTILSLAPNEPEEKRNEEISKINENVEKLETQKGQT
jgi:hypothetical protein